MGLHLSSKSCKRFKNFVFQIIFGVDSKDLIPLEDFTVDVAVCLGAWVGMVRHIKSKVRVKFHDGSIVCIDDHVAEELEDIFDKRDDVSLVMQKLDPFYIRLQQGFTTFFGSKNLYLVMKIFYGTPSW